MTNYGSLTFRDGAFYVICQPHVVIRLKRLFPRISDSQHGEIRIQATDETACDLEWFMHRFPLQMDSGTSARLTDSAEAYRDRTRKVESILAGRIEPGNFGLAVPLRPSQEVAANLAYHRKSLLLADDVGVGKTGSAIGLMVRPDTLPALVVTPTHLPMQWRGQIARFTPHLSSHIVKTGTPYDLVARHCRGKKGPKVLPDVIIINYAKLAKWADVLAPLIRTVVWEEVQALRRDGSAKSAAARVIAEAATWRLALSATPILNLGGEIWNVLRNVDPDALGSFYEFQNEWCGATPERPERTSIRNPVAFGTYLRESGLMLRRTRKDVGRELGPHNKCVEYVDADLAALNSVSDACAELARAILKNGNEEYRGQKMHQAEEFSIVLRQATGIAKAPYVAEFVRLLLDSEEKILLSGWHREVYSIWLDRLKEFNPVLYTGSESPSQKEKSKEAFINGKSRLMIISLRSGEGVDGLQHVCRTNVHGELDWSSGVMEQLDGRLHRDGQKDPVFSYYLLSNFGADPTIAQMLGIKKRQLDGIRATGDETLFERIQSDTGRIRLLAENYLRHLEERHDPEDADIPEPAVVHVAPVIAPPPPQDENYRLFQ